MAIIRPDFPDLIDSTARKDLVSCPYKFNIHRVRKLKAKGISPHLHFGGAYAKGLEVTRKAYYDEGLSLPLAIKLGGESIVSVWGDYLPPEHGTAVNKTLSNCLVIHDDYFRQYHPYEDFLTPVTGADGKGAIEFSFAIPIPELIHPQKNEPILYAGKFDMLAEHINGAGIFVNDEKTTGNLGSHWAKSWQLASQMTGYVWGAKSFGYPIAGVSVRGVSITKTGNPNHLQVMEQRDQWMIDRWLEQLQRDIRRAIGMWEEGYWDMALDDACISYGGCDLLGICTSKDPETWLANDFEEDTWSPLRED